MRQVVNTEERKAEHGGPGAPGERIIRPDGPGEVRPHNGGSGSLAAPPGPPPPGEVLPPPDGSDIPIQEQEAPPVIPPPMPPPEGAEEHLERLRIQQDVGEKP
jgi:hypothetical protein